MERFTCWSQYTNARYVNEGVRIDFVLVDKDLYDENVKQEGEGFDPFLFLPVEPRKGGAEWLTFSLSLSLFLLAEDFVLHGGREDSGPTSEQAALRMATADHAAARGGSCATSCAGARRRATPRPSRGACGRIRRR